MKKIYFLSALLCASFLNAQTYNFNTATDTEGMAPITGGVTVTQSTIETRGVVQLDHAGKGQPSFGFTNTITASANKELVIVFQNNSNANQLRVKTTGTTWTGANDNIISNSSTWQTLTLDLSALEGYAADGTYTLVIQFRNNSTALSGDIYVDSMKFQPTTSLSTKDFNTFESNIYPNPVKDLLNINTDESIQKMEVLDILGKTILTTTTGKTVDVSSLNKRIYFLKLTSNKGVSTNKFVKK